MSNMSGSSKVSRGLFVNSRKAQDSIYKSGVMIYAHLKNSKTFDLDYVELNSDAREIKTDYDFFAFNYHPATMPSLDIESLRNLRGLKLTFVLETLPDFIFACVARESFDVFCPIDPTITKEFRKIYPLARPLEPRLLQSRPLAKSGDIPIIGTFGFATQGKGYELVVDAVSREFDRALVRINIPSSQYMDRSTYRFHNRPYAEYLSNLAKQCAKPGIEVQVTHEYYDKEKLIEWCAENTLNCFLYSRDLTGLAATTDQAISSGQPLAISDNPTFRHIHPYLTPYPFRNLRQSIEISRPEVMRIQHDWSGANFVSQFEAMLDDCLNHFSPAGNASASVHRLGKSLARRKITRLGNRLKRLGRRFRFSQGQETAHKTESIHNTSFRSRKSVGKRILLVSNRSPRSQIHQYGINIAQMLSRSMRYSYAYAEVDDQHELDAEIMKSRPSAVIYNYHQLTMPWLSKETLKKYDCCQLGLTHGMTRPASESAEQGLFDYKLVPDPTFNSSNSQTFSLPRPVPSFGNQIAAPTIPTVGSFSFSPMAVGDVERLINLVQDQFDEAKISFQILGDSASKKTDTADLIARCNAFVRKPRIRLEIGHDIRTHTEILNFLTSNTINVFLSVENPAYGLSTATDYALAVQRPLAISRAAAFSHLFGVSPSICVENSSLGEIIDRDVAGLIPFSEEWSHSRFVMAVNSILDRLLERRAGTRPAQLAPATPVVSISIGELIDRITILEIKAERIADPSKVANVRKELDLLNESRAWRAVASGDVARLKGELRQVNEMLWEIEDRIRACEHERKFGPEFVELARSVYKTNDRRSALKRQINEITGSEIVEEKAYSEYS